MTAPIKRGTARRLGLRAPSTPTVRWSCTCEACLEQKPWLRMGKLPPDNAWLAEPYRSAFWDPRVARAAAVMGETPEGVAEAALPPGSMTVQQPTRFDYW